jgi:hypothetical protein
MGQGEGSVSCSCAGACGAVRPATVPGTPRGFSMSGAACLACQHTPPCTRRHAVRTTRAARGACPHTLAHSQVGGSELGLRAAKPLLSLMGRSVLHLGAAGAGQIAKICNNLVRAGVRVPVCVCGRLCLCVLVLGYVFDCGGGVSCQACAY